MKLMKHITIALVLCAIPAMAFGQSVTCDDCSHVVSVYNGHGGFIAMAAEDAEMVTWVATCEGVTRSGELTPSDGMVSMLLMDDTACYGDGMDDENNSFELGPIMDGGWYWITDATNSAVGGLVNKMVLDNEATMLANAGDGVTMTMGKGAVLLKETATGRVGLLPNILPMMEMDPPMANPCGFTGAGTAASAFARKVSNCSMGNGGTFVLANYTNTITGATTQVMDGDSVTRPGGTSDLEITIDLWGNGTGHFLTATTSTADNGGDFVLGQKAVAGANRAARYTGVTYSGTVGSGPGSADIPTSGTTADADAGIVLDGTTTANVASVSVGANSDYCSKTNNHTAAVKINVIIDAAGSALVTPNVARNATSGLANSISFNVVCPAASANQGVELVPENPFPTE